MMDILSSFDANTVQALAAVRTPGTTQLFMSITALGSTVLIGGSVFSSVSISSCAVAFHSWRVLRSLSGEPEPFSLPSRKRSRVRDRPPLCRPTRRPVFVPERSRHDVTRLLRFSRVPRVRNISRGPLSRRRDGSRHGLVWFIGFSRVYLGVHYPSDVGAGFVIAAIFLWLAVVVTKNSGKTPSPVEWRLRGAREQREGEFQLFILYHPSIQRRSQ